TQINKYLPGNVFHFVSRDVISKDEKTAHASLVFATTLELLSVATSASIVALVASEFSPSEHRYAKYAEIFLVAIAVGLFAIILATLKKPSFRSEWPSLALGFLGHLSYI